MTDNEIIKALECCRTANCFDCRNCPYKGKYDNSALYRDCCNLLMNDALDIINRQKEEIERLQDYNENLRCINTDLSNNLLYEVETARADAVKEFAERVKKEVVGWIYDLWEIDDTTDALTDIDNLVKEFTGGDTK